MRDRKLLLSWVAGIAIALLMFGFVPCALYLGREDVVACDWNLDYLAVIIAFCLMLSAVASYACLRELILDLLGTFGILEELSHALPVAAGAAPSGKGVEHYGVRPPKPEAGCLQSHVPGKCESAVTPTSCIWHDGICRPSPILEEDGFGGGITCTVCFFRCRFSSTAPGVGEPWPESRLAGYRTSTDGTRLGGRLSARPAEPLGSLLAGERTASLFSY